MGATNAMAAYVLYAAKVPPLSMQVLLYMALVSRDGETRPWFGQGHAALAAGALGRPYPITDADLRSVRRAMAPLTAVGAIETDRKAAPNRDGWTTARYRLNLSIQLSMDWDVDNHVGNPVESERSSMT